MSRVLKLPRSLLSRLTSAEAARYHWQAMLTDPAHERSACWCCCATCDFNVLRVIHNDREEAASGLYECHLRSVAERRVSALPHLPGA